MNKPLNQKLEVVPPAGPVYNINTFRIIQVNRQLLQVVGGIRRKTREGCYSPQGCIDLRVAGRVTVAMKTLGISSHDIDDSKESR